MMMPITIGGKPQKLDDTFRLFGSSLGKRTFSYGILRLNKAILQNRFMANSTEKREELICAVLMR